MVMDDAAGYHILNTVNAIHVEFKTECARFRTWSLQVVP